MTYRLLLLGLVLLVESHCIQTRDEITDKKNSAEDGPSFSLRGNIRDTSEEKDSYTAGNTKCGQDHKCGYHQDTSYSWCYTDDSNNWEYCCTGTCFKDKNFAYMKCDTGNINSYCGNPGLMTVSGKKCLSSHPCGTHGGSDMETNRIGAM